MEYMKQEISIKNTLIKNRLVMPSMATAKSSDDGRVSQPLYDYYQEKSKGGYIGLIIIEHCFISKQGKASNGQLSVAEEKDVDGLKELVRMIHDNDSKVMAQINHAGSATTTEITGTKVVGPSPIIHPRRKEGDELIPHELDKDEIQLIIEDFANAARRVKEAGFDGVEIHSAHGYLLNQFYSPLTNHRKDEYGSDKIENRIRLHMEIIKAVRDVVGTDYPIALRLGGCDYSEGGSTIEDSVLACKLFEKAAVDLLDISGGMCGYLVAGRNEPGYFRDMTSRIKEEVSIPVMLTGGITSMESAEQLLEAKAADLIGVGRAILKDSLWAKKAFQN